MKIQIGRFKLALSYRYNNTHPFTPPGSEGVPPAKIEAKMASLPGKGRGSEQLRYYMGRNSFVYHLSSSITRS